MAGVDKQVTARAKEILKKLERADVINTRTNVEEVDLPIQSETERIIKELDLNNLTPMQAFIVLSDLHEKLTKE